MPDWRGPVSTTTGNSRAARRNAGSRARAISAMERFGRVFHNALRMHYSTFAASRFSNPKSCRRWIMSPLTRQSLSAPSMSACKAVRLTLPVKLPWSRYGQDETGFTSLADG